MATIKINETAIPIHVDAHGNLYLEHNNKLFQLNVDRNNEPYFDAGSYDIVARSTSELSDDMAVAVRTGKIVKSTKFVDDKYFPEDNSHSLILQDSESETEEETYFVFYQKENKINVVERVNGDVDALYDIFIYDDACTNSCNNSTRDVQLMFQSKLHNDMCIYRVILYTNGRFFFRPIGCSIEHGYKLDIKDDVISIVKYK